MTVPFLLLLIAVAGAQFAFGLLTTAHVWRSSSYDAPQKAMQTALVWGLPIFGLLAVRAVISYDAEYSGRGSWLFGGAADHHGAMAGSSDGAIWTTYGGSPAGDGGHAGVGGGVGGFGGDCGGFSGGDGGGACGH
jgi:hypothetical protein